MHTLTSSRNGPVALLNGRSPETSPQRRALRVRGTVQGVGFRPAVYRLARAHGLGGFVRNERECVRIEIEGPLDRLADFVRRLPEALPPAAHLDSIDDEWLAVRAEREFRIEESPRARDDRPAAAVPCDRAPCAACLRELADPRDRRHRYPFINCTDCGPRFTILERLPYDRASTTMRHFTLCAACRREYESPADRRFHAEPNACPACGPVLCWVEGDETRARGERALQEAARALSGGSIVAVKGAGGFVLAADAQNADALARLRRRKRRPHKAFAVMARDVAEVERWVELDAAARSLLSSPARPIVLLPRRADVELPDSLAPGLADLGVCLPPTPLQELLARDGPGLQVMTSGNVSDEPIAIDNDEARRRLAEIADAFLLHDRAIHARADDSVVRMLDGAAVPIRRARGYAPDAIALPARGPALLAVGGQGKSTLCFAHDGRAVLSSHLGELHNPESFAAFEDAAQKLSALAGITPCVVAHDLHPDYDSTRWALQLGLPCHAVQHHHAHVAACMAEHARCSPVLGVVLDGTGFGPDGTLWGGEILIADLFDYRRVGHLCELELPGGAAAIRQPFRCALAALAAAGEDAALPSLLPNVPAKQLTAVRRLLGSPFSTRATGAGRWFDAVAALVLGHQEISYDGQAAMELEAIAGDGSAQPYAFALRTRPGRPFVIDLHPGVRELSQELRGGAAAEHVAARFHATMAEAVVQACARAREEGAPEAVALSGGCFQNRLLTRRVRRGLDALGFEVLMHRRVPPNDGGLALGQAAVVSHRLARAAGGHLETTEDVPGHSR